MKKLFLLLASAALFLTGCGSPRMQVDPEWKEVPQKVSVLVTTPYVKNLDDVIDDFQSEDAFNEWFVSYFASNFSRSSASKVEVFKVVDETFEMKQMPINKQTFPVPLPIKEKLNGISGIVVSVHPVKFWREFSQCPSGGCINNKSLESVVSYSIVSVDDQKILAYGYAVENSTFTFAMTKSNWESVVIELVDSILDKTPIEK